ncbi:MAG: putative metalloprotease CJM1_0395 family protein [Trichlorobacter sp.]|uniref:putative metalloprotease CJM1_0395 family protein n=1 Tax=Trichlorobacter sp. TaxID=2911007 RepID=UPI00256C3614|nr:putative metalloprotease CJM1_0395 family protein [Trichlorobacter sp.]MDK9716398.1 putative metalloprotease CJM1_0395 family protein [Trichlorobacter sp.]
MDPLSSISNSGYAAVTQTGSTRNAEDRQAASGAEQNTTATTASGIKLPEDTVTLSVKQPDTKSTEKTSDNTEPAQTAPKPGEKTTVTGQSIEDPAIQAQVAKLKQTEEKVKAHEAAHKAVGGNLASSASYSYTRGPDGRSYITGGEVQIDMSDGRTPQETISRMQQVIRAALAPSDPSGQDRSVAAAAASRMAEAQQDKVQADSAAPEQDAAQPVDPAKEAIDAALAPEKSGESSARSGSKTTDAQVKNAYGNPAVQDSDSSSSNRSSRSQSNRSVRDITSLISSFA